MDGVELLEAVKKNKTRNSYRYDFRSWGYGTAINTMRMGALYFKTPDLNRLLSRSETHWTKKKLVSENKILKKKVSKNYEMIGKAKH
jgi:DNA-binding NtrC family response regulator